MATCLYAHGEEEPLSVVEHAELSHAAQYGQGADLMNRQVVAGPSPSRAYLAIGHGCGRTLQQRHKLVNWNVDNARPVASLQALGRQRS